jgi:methylglutaconyl-CoA hydratase
MPNKKSAHLGVLREPAGLLVERSGQVLRFTLDAAETGNIVTGAMLQAMLAELRTQAKRPHARVLRISARGDAFCAGRERAGHNALTLRKEARRIVDFKRALRMSPLITIAEVQGDALGFGFGLAILCDFALVAQNASLGFPEMRKGLAPTAIMSYLGEYSLPRHAFPMVLFGESIDAHRALQIGLISQVCARDRLASEADTLVERILTLDEIATRRCKQFFLNAQQNSFEKNCRLAIDALTAGSLALLDKRK